MTRAIVAALMAASILPQAASAQDAHGDRQGHQPHGGAQAGQGGQAPHDARPQPQPQPQQQPQQQPQRGSDHGGYPNQPPRGIGTGGNRPGPDARPGSRPPAPGWARPGSDGGYGAPRYGAPRFAGAAPGRWSNDWHRDARYNWNAYRAYNRNAFHLPRYYAPGGWGYGYRRFGVGVRIAAPLFARDYWLADPWAYRLPAAYGPYRWVRYYDDALLIDLRTGDVVDAAYGIFW